MLANVDWAPYYFLAISMLQRHCPGSTTSYHSPKTFSGETITAISPIKEIKLNTYSKSRYVSDVRADTSRIHFSCMRA